MDWRTNWTPQPGSTAQGGQGTVKKVEHKTTKQLGALKVMHSKNQKRMQARQRMTQEVSAIRRAAGYGVPQVLEANESDVSDMDAPLYIVQEWVDGLTLDAYSGNQPVDLDNALDIVRQLADVLARAHENGVIHRDIKPGNIIIDSASKLYLVDFGISWIDAEIEEEDRQYITRADEELGNRFLRLPEMAPGGTRNDKRTDITFSVGILFYLLTGLAPRMLLSATGRAPHEEWEKEFTEATRQDPRWTSLTRFFKVGFEQSIDFRFQSAQGFREGLDKIVEPSREQSDLDATLSSFGNFREQAAVKAMITIQRDWVHILHIMEAFFRDYAEAHELQPIFNAGGARLISSMHAEGNLVIHVKGVSTPSVQARYEIKRNSQDQSKIIAVYVINNFGTTFHQGQAIDTESLRDAASHAQEVILSTMIKVLMHRINESVNNV